MEHATKFHLEEAKLELEKRLGRDISRDEFFDEMTFELPGEG